MKQEQDKKATYNDSGKNLYDYPCEKSDADVILQDGIEVIKAHAFHGGKMKKIIIPASVRIIERNAFSFCRELQEVRFLGDKTIVREGAFLYCNEKMIVTTVKPVRFDEMHRMSGKVFLSRNETDIILDKHCNNPRFLQLAQECAKGNSEKMWELGIFFENMGNEQFYQLVSNFWKYRSLLYGNFKAENWIKNWFSVHPDETMPALLEEQPHGDYSGNLLYCAGFITFDRQEENYHIDMLGEDGISEVMTAQKIVDYDLYDI